MNARTETLHFIYILGNLSFSLIELSERYIIFFIRETQLEPHQLDLASPETIKQALFVKDRPLVVLIHGYTGHKDFSPNTEIRPGKS